MKLSDIFEIIETDLGRLQNYPDRVCAILFRDGKLDAIARCVNRLTGGAIDRIIASEGFENRKSGDIITIPFPPGMVAQAVDLVILERNEKTKTLRKSGADVAEKFGSQNTLIAMGTLKDAAEFVLGCALRVYTFKKHSTKALSGLPTKITFMHRRAEVLRSHLPSITALVSGVHFTRDLVNEPANVLSTSEFADRLKKLQSIGIDVDVIEEDQMTTLGMGALLCVGKGSNSPSKMVIMQWKGGREEEVPLALVGKGVVFDTGGISLKTATGMSEMIIDMGGAGVVAGTMKALALRKSKANVVGLLGLVENMPSGSAVRPGDIVTSMKGDTIEVLNTDAEGRLVLSDLLWYAQERFNPSAVIDLATLTGAIIVALGTENAGLFSNDDAFSAAIANAARDEAEGVWRMPLSDEYDKLIQSNSADIANMGNAGRNASSIVAAQFLQRFIKKGTRWAHLDIAGVTYSKKGGEYSPPGATGWGVLTLNRLVRDMMENG